MKVTAVPIIARDLELGDLFSMTGQDWLFCFGFAVSLTLMFWGLITLAEAL